MNNQQDRYGDKFIRQFIDFVSQGYIYYALFTITSAVCLLLELLLEASLVLLGLFYKLDSIFSVNKLNAIFSVLSLGSAILVYFNTNIPSSFYQSRLFKNILKCFRYLVILLLLCSCLFALVSCILMFYFIYSPVYSKSGSELTTIVLGILSPFIVLFSYISSFTSKDKNKINFLLLPIILMIFIVSIVSLV